jgi:hypothetical protein
LCLGSSSQQTRKIGSSEKRLSVDGYYRFTLLAAAEKFQT